MSKATRCLACLTLAMVMLFTAAVQPLAKTRRTSKANAKQNYKWFISLNKEIKGSKKIKKVRKYKVIVIDSQNYSASQIKKLKKAGHIVYSYLNIGSVESNRKYFKKFKKYKLKTYDNWEDEYWVNVSKKKWRNFIVNKIASKMVKKGVDGFWVDNCDVYEYNRRKSIYKGLVKILTKLRRFNKTVILNGGDKFVTPLIKSGKKNLIDGVVQEEVLTQITSYSGSGSFSSQRNSFRRYYENYFKTVKRAGLSVGVLEYTRSGSKKSEIRSYCRKKGFNYCISSTIII